MLYSQPRRYDAYSASKTYNLLRTTKIIKLLKRLLNKAKKPAGHISTFQPKIIPEAKHLIPRDAIHRNAIKVLERLTSAGYNAYLVGGCVRDLLLGKRPKDFDVATNAHPEEIRRLFKNCRLIGKRFRLAHILFGKEIIEVATFRAHHQNAAEQHAKMRGGMIVRDNVFGTMDEDVIRRDFSINALYFNLLDHSVIDYTDGMTDIKNRTLRIIGNAEQRFQEDPVRLLRAVRFVGKLQLTMDPETERVLTRLYHLLGQVAPARLYQEVLKFFQEGAAEATFKLMQKYQLFGQLFSQTAGCLHQPETYRLVEAALRGTDQRIQQGKSISPAFLFAALLWRPIAHQTARQKNVPPYLALEQGLQTVLKFQIAQLAMPRTLTTAIREICTMQHNLTQRHGSRPFRTLEHSRFRAGYDLLLLRAEAGEIPQELADWWKEFYACSREEQENMVKEISKPLPQRKRRYRNRRTKKTSTTQQS